MICSLDFSSARISCDASCALAETESVTWSVT